MSDLVFDRHVLRGDAVEVAPLLLGAVLRKGGVSVEITEVEAYLGDSDPGSHAFRGRTPRNSVMFGGPGRLYTYFTYGMHVCANVVCGDEGRASGVLIRAGRIVEGIETARGRRTTSRTDDDLARGPARLTVALGITLDDGGADLLGGPSASETAVSESALNERPTLRTGQHVSMWRSGPRTGVAGPGGTDAFPWRFWIPDDPTVSPYRRHLPKRTPGVAQVGR